jgi:hypothetical protein
LKKAIKIKRDDCRLQAKGEAEISPFKPGASVPEQPEFGIRIKSSSVLTAL